MAISQQELKHILTLSKLSAKPKELVQFEYDLNNIFNLFDNLKLVDTHEIKPMISPLLSHYPAREDAPQAQNHEQDFKRIAPEFSEHYFIVPKVIE
ncbi:Asp-tRNA(Asn)/Glu-tRNA(Gln) amidotransferase subunit GatC [Cysteiniphilum sp. 6C5]|uniref:Asp-tRNA(Asn)/Glu-tRNA(Gln) amidotransferase subunit GatC n=1 Tax=unclassified Cysteiniphilum TaxID=2610889 RepID=UPI003F84D3F1